MAHWTTKGERVRLISQRNEDRGSRGRAAKLLVRREGRQQRASCLMVQSRRPALGLGLRGRENSQTYFEDRFFSFFPHFFRAGALRIS